LIVERRELVARLGLRLIPGLGNVLYRRLLLRFGAAERVLSASTAELRSVDKVSQNLAGHIRDRRFSRDPEEELAALETMGGHLLFFDQEEYPPNLRYVHHPPVMLYALGRLEASDRNAVAIVGSRFATRAGLDHARRLGRDLAAAGVTVVSGLARGVDAAAHRGALAAGGRTVGVLGCGLDVDYPPENRELKARLAAAGAVVTEYPLGYPPDARHFPVRNRIIAGMSLGLVVVEAGDRSGALISARLALEEGREVFAVPGDPTSTRSRGPQRLIDQGAKAVLEAEQILDELAPVLAGLQRQLPGIKEMGWELPPAIGSAKPEAPQARPAPVRARPKAAGKSRPIGEKQEGPAEIILGLLGKKPVHIDLLVRKSGLGVSEVAVTLLNLELSGRVLQKPGKFFMRPKEDHV
jgi:DNA processing protein